ncbi:dTDP-4-dehydrorhamnose reductase [candidate division KSB1 bacterium]|nr:dTDP-4-dehydrorhamnose reductase [candidate division KSB1 bacterium]
MKKIAIIGADGQLGTDLAEVFSEKHEVASLTIQDIRIENFDQVQEVLSGLEPDVILNTAAYHRVPDCESNQALAFQVNAIGAQNVAKVAQDLGAVNVYYSTDYVFDGAKGTPHVETDAPNPQSVYAISKLAGEYFTRHYCDKHFVVRVSGIYGKVPSLIKGNNFVTSMLKLANEKPEVRVVDDEILTPTPTLEIAKNTLLLIETDHYGVVHMTSEGACSWYEFASVIWSTLDLKTPLHRAKVSDFPPTVKRPSYSVLENDNLKKLGINCMSTWKEGLIHFLKEKYLEGGV